MNNTWVYIYLIVFALFDLVLFMYGAELWLRRLRKLAPAVPSNSRLRDAIVKQITVEMPGAKTILDIGSGWGTMARTVGKNFPQAKIVGIEIMPLTYFYSVIKCAFMKNVEFVRGNAFKYLEKNKNQKYDIGIAYLLTPMMPKLESFVSQFRILLVLDFPLPNIKPDKKIKLHKDGLGQHYLYVYKNK